MRNLSGYGKMSYVGAIEKWDLSLFFQGIGGPANQNNRFSHYNMFDNVSKTSFARFQ